jgi:hypothetical protein
MAGNPYENQQNEDSGRFRTQADQEYHEAAYKDPYVLKQQQE